MDTSTITIAMLALVGGGALGYLTRVGIQRAKDNLEAEENHRAILKHRAHLQELEDSGHGASVLAGELPADAAFIVVPRVLATAMPDRWQSDLGELLHRLAIAFPKAPRVNYVIRCKRNDGKFVQTPEAFLGWDKDNRNMLHVWRGSR